MPFQRVPSGIEDVGRMYAQRGQPYVQANANRPFQDKMRLLQSIYEFAENQQRKREIREAEEAGGGPLGGGVGAGAGAIVGTMIAPGIGTAIGAGLGASAGGAIGSAIDPPGGPAGAARASSFQQAYQAMAPLAGGVVGGFHGMSPGGEQVMAVNPNPVGTPGSTTMMQNQGQTFGQGFMGTMQQLAPYYRAQQQYGPYGAMGLSNDYITLIRSGG